MPSKAPRGQYQRRADCREQERYEQALPEHDRQQRGEGLKAVMNMIFPSMLPAIVAVLLNPIII